MAREPTWLPKFNRDWNFQVHRPFKINDAMQVVGQPFDKTLTSTRTLRQLYEQRKLLAVSIEAIPPSKVEVITPSPKPFVPPAPKVMIPNHKKKSRW